MTAFGVILVRIFRHSDQNNSEYGHFSLSVRNANITPVHKKGDPTDKVNYRPASVLPLLSKIFERVIYKQQGEYMNLF